MSISASPPITLTEAQLRQFISHGYMVLHTDFPADFHNATSRRIQEVIAKEGNPGNNILPRVPELQEIFRHPVIRGALSSVLGPAYIMHPHRHCHFTTPGRAVQSWHKDSYWGYDRVRNHHPWWAMIFYYDHTVDEPLGPSSLLAGTQYYHDRWPDEREQDVHLLGAAGTMALIHYDLWHRGNANVSDRTRSMLKFQFVRMSRPAPAGPRAKAWRSMNGDSPPNVHETIWRHQWDWLNGNTEPARANRPAGDSIGAWIDALGSTDQQVRLHAADALGQLGTAACDATPALAARLADRVEPVALNAAYALAGMGTTGITALAVWLQDEDMNTARNAAYGLAASGAPAAAMVMDALGHACEHVRAYAAFALGETGLAGSEREFAGVSELAKLAGDESARVRRTMAEALGTLDVAMPDASAKRVDTLCQLLADADDQVRFNCALSLARIGPMAAPAVPALQHALQDENRYVRANAVDALNRIGTPDAHHILIDYLLATRWCPSTTPESLF